MVKFEIISKVKDFKPSNSKLIRSALDHFNGKTILITIQRLKAKRSHLQNNFLHLLFDIYSKELIEYTGDRKYTPSHVKNLCKTSYLTKDDINEKTGQVMGTYVKDTSALNKEEMSDFYDQIIQGAAEQHGIILPYPNEKLILKFE